MGEIAGSYWWGWLSLTGELTKALRASKQQRWRDRGWSVGQDSFL
jgi:hypothetical protein